MCFLFVSVSGLNKCRTDKENIHLSGENSFHTTCHNLKWNVGHFSLSLVSIKTSFPIRSETVIHISITHYQRKVQKIITLHIHTLALKWCREKTRKIQTERMVEDIGSGIEIIISVQLWHVAVIWKPCSPD